MKQTGFKSGRCATGKDGRAQGIIGGPVMPLILLLVGLWAFPALSPGVGAQPFGGGTETANIPLFIDPNRLLEKPSDIPSSITFLTTLDFPPFNFRTAEGQLSGFNVDLAREICEELKVRCQMRLVAFDRIVRGLIDGKGDAAIAGLAETRRTRRRLRFTLPYLRMAGRFAVNRAKTVNFPPGAPREAEDSATAGATDDPSDAASVSVVTDSAHAAFIRHYFPQVQIKGYETPDAAREALRDGEVDLHFGDALSLSFWLQSDRTQSCCAFQGGAYFDETYFGRGLSIALPKEAVALRSTLNYALQRTIVSGKFAELYLRYFPLSLY